MLCKMFSLSSLNYDEDFPMGSRSSNTIQELLNCREYGKKNVASSMVAVYNVRKGIFCPRFYNNATTTGIIAVVVLYVCSQTARFSYIYWRT